MSKRKINILDKIGKIIPGYTKYAERDEKRSDEKNYRVTIIDQLTESLTYLVNLQKTKIKDENIDLAIEIEHLSKYLRVTIEKIKYTPYGVSSLFSANEIKTEELNTIIEFDKELSETSNLIVKVIADKFNITDSLENITGLIDKLNSQLKTRANYINKFK